MKAAIAQRPPPRAAGCARGDCGACRIVTPGGSETSPYSAEVVAHGVTFLEVSCP